MSDGRRSVRRSTVLTVLFAIVAPGTTVGLLPWLVARWFPEPSFEGPWRWVGFLLIVPGGLIVADSMLRFVREGRGTPAPVAPPDRLVITGLFRFVRNPMYVGIVSVALGEALLYGRLAVFAYAGLLWLAFHLFVVVYEEPNLRATFGAAYEGYLRTVPRWIPRFPG